MGLCECFFYVFKQSERKINNTCVSYNVMIVRLDIMPYLHWKQIHFTELLSFWKCLLQNELVVIICIFQYLHILANLLESLLFFFFTKRMECFLRFFHQVDPNCIHLIVLFSSTNHILANFIEFRFVLSSVVKTLFLKHSLVLLQKLYIGLHETVGSKLAIFNFFKNVNLFNWYWIQKQHNLLFFSLKLNQYAGFIPSRGIRPPPNKGVFSVGY